MVQVGVQAVHRALDILSLFTTAQPTLGITEISAGLGLTKPTVHNLVKTLVQRGLLTQDPETRRYRLGLQLYEYGAILSSNLKINQVASGPMERLVNRTGLMARLGIWYKDTVLTTLSLTPDSTVRQVHQLGLRGPGYCTAVGKAILASLSPEELADYLETVSLLPYTPHSITDTKILLQNLEQVRRRGYAIDNEEYLLGLACVAAPIMDRTGKPIAAISVSGEPGILRNERFSMVYELLQTSSQISRLMGYQIEAKLQNGESSR